MVKARKTRRREAKPAKPTGSAPGAASGTASSGDGAFIKLTELHTKVIRWKLRLAKGAAMMAAGAKEVIEVIKEME